MSAEDNKALIRRFYYEGWNTGNIDLYDELVTEDFIDHRAAIPGIPAGREGFKQMNAMLHAAFPVQVELESIVADDDSVAARWRSVGTHAGELWGIPATGKHVDFTATVFYLVRDGRLAEGWINRDDLGLMRQIGVVPS
jgi:steroid delta-isomerase-like uncharacterized protein